MVPLNYTKIILTLKSYVFYFKKKRAIIIRDASLASSDFISEKSNSSKAMKFKF